MFAIVLITVIDDDQFARNAVVGLVRSLGFSVSEFQSAAEFLESTCRARTACLIVDDRMPVMTGLGLCRHLIASGIPIPTIIVTAFPNDARRKDALRTGAKSYLAKPLEPDELLHCIRCAVEHRN